LSSAVTRHFATLGQTQVHYRRAGVGPAVLLLHQSPSSSAELVPLMQRLAGRFTVIAPDMPGYGASDACAGVSLSIEFLADRVASFMDELAIGRAAVYGFHTGASVALCLARRHSRRLTLAICEGLLCLDEAERQEFLSRYIEPFTPRFDGGHLAWLWTRLKDQSLFFPWYERTAAARLELDATPVAALAARAEDWLRSGAGYAAGYAAAFNYDPRADLPFIDGALIAQCHRHDPLAAHLPRLSPLPARSAVRCFGTAEERFDLLQAALLRHADRSPAPPVARTRPIAGQVWQDYVVAQGAALRVLRTDAGAGPAIVVQHAAQSSAGACRDWLAVFGEQGPAVAIELPGHGDSERPAGLELEDPACSADCVSGVLDALGLSECEFVGCEAGGAVQVEVARRRPSRARSITLVGALDLTQDPALQAALRASYAAPAVDSYGGYLLRAWHEARDHLLFFPWYERRRAFAPDAAPSLAPAFLQTRTLDALLAGDAGVALRRAEIGYPLLARLRELAILPRHAAACSDPRHAHSRALAVAARDFITLPADPACCARAIGAFIHRESS
jgi:pimeloyl-ACP methyl ester carboxylesterase